jgi:hypothetical protein
MYSEAVKEVRMMKHRKFNSKRIPFEYVGKNYCIWKLPTKLCSCSKKIEQCPICSSELKKDFTLIPVSKDRKAKINGLLCSHCKCLYTTDADFVELIMRDNKFSKGFTLDGEEFWDYSFRKERQKQIEKSRKRKEEYRKWEQSKKNFLETIPSSEVLISIQYSDGMKEEIIIVKEKCNENKTKNIYHYVSNFGKEVLSATFARERKRMGFYNNKTYKIIKQPVFRNSYKESMFGQLLLTELNIKSGGGYYTEIKNNRYELVDVLVYSLYTNRYEIMRATYSKDEHNCFVDISLYREFVKEYGRPNMMPSFENRRKSLYVSELNEESILKGYGYEVNKQANLSTQYRHDLLAEIIDLEILPAPRIVSFLNWLVNIHTHQSNAQLKWKEDIEFVENYKANPQRFLIAK